MGGGGEREVNVLMKSYGVVVRNYKVKWKIEGLYMKISEQSFFIDKMVHDLAVFNLYMLIWLFF